MRRTYEFALAAAMLSVSAAGQAPIFTPHARLKVYGSGSVSVFQAAKRPIRQAITPRGEPAVLVDNSGVGKTPEPKKTVGSKKITTKPANGLTVAYHTILFPTGKTVAAPSSRWTYFFDLKPGFGLLPGAYALLQYDYSPTLTAGQGSLTLLLNGQPVSSMVLPTAKRGTWKVSLPPTFFRTGSNALQLAIRSKSSDGACQEADSDANWIRFGAGSALVFQRKNKPSYGLDSWPFPYFDALSSKPNAPICIEPGAPEAEISAALDLAGSVSVALSKPTLATVLQNAPGRAGVNLVQGDLADVPSKSARITGTSVGLKPAISIVGPSADSLLWAVDTLSRPTRVALMRGSSEIIDQPPPAPPVVDPRARLGSFDLSDLGFHTVTVTGGFHQSATMTIMRPLRTDLGHESMIEVHFRHSEVLEPQRSVLNIFINGIPIGSARLTHDNASGGTIKAYLPAEQINKSRWVIDFAVYHDLGQVDCSKSFDDVAWTTILNDSSFTLKPGLLPGRPYLEGFPYLIPREGVVPPATTMALSVAPSATELSAAATIAARAARSNGIALKWSAVKGPVPGSPKSDSEVVVGYYSEGSRLASLAPKLLVAPQGAGFKIDPGLDLPASALKDAVLTQAIASPWNDNGVTYVVLAQDDKALSAFTHYLATSSADDSIAGRAVLFTSDHRLVPLGLIDEPENLKEKFIDQNRYTTTMRGITTAVVLSLILFFVWLFSRFVKKKPAPG